MNFYWICLFLLNYRCTLYILNRSTLSDIYKGNTFFLCLLCLFNSIMWWTEVSTLKKSNSFFILWLVFSVFCPYDLSLPWCHKKILPCFLWSFMPHTYIYFRICWFNLSPIVSLKMMFREISSFTFVWRKSIDPYKYGSVLLCLYQESIAI